MVIEAGNGKDTGGMIYAERAFPCLKRLFHDEVEHFTFPSRLNCNDFLIFGKDISGQIFEG
jgi:hypothetical protein